MDIIPPLLISSLSRALSCFFSSPPLFESDNDGTRESWQGISSTWMEERRLKINHGDPFPSPHPMWHTAMESSKLLDTETDMSRSSARGFLEFLLSTTRVRGNVQKMIPREKLDLSSLCVGIPSLSDAWKFSQESNRCDGSAVNIENKQLSFACNRALASRTKNSGEAFRDMEKYRWGKSFTCC